MIHWNKLFSSVILENELTLSLLGGDALVAAGIYLVNMRN